MDQQLERPFRRFSPWLLAVALSPAVMQFGPCSPAIGDPTLSALEVVVLGQNQISAFDSTERVYNVWLPLSADTAIVRAYSTDPDSVVSYNFSKNNVYQGTLETIDSGYFPTGGGEITLDGLLPEGPSALIIHVRAPGGARALHTVVIQVGCSDCDDGNECTTNGCDTSVDVCFHPPEPDDTFCDNDGNVGTCASGLCQEGFPCSEQGIRDAIAIGGGPHTFACDGPQTVATQTEIVIDNDVILDGEGNLIVDGNDDHRVLSVLPGVTAELVGMTITRGLAVVSEMGSGIYNRGTLTLIDSVVSFNRDSIFIAEDAAAIHSEGTLVLINSVVSNNESSQSGSVLCTGSTTLINSTISENDGGDISGIEYYGDGFLHVINSTVIGSPRLDEGGAIGFGFGLSGVFEVRVSNSILVSRNSEPTCARFAASWTSGGGNIEVPGDTCNFTDSTDLVNVTEAELILGPLAHNGGPTMTHALLAGSVAIDRIPAAMCVDENGGPLTADQRGEARPQGAACDAGAFEWADCPSVACEDGNVCTSYACNTMGLCQITAIPDGTPCSPGPACDLGDGMCLAGVCENTSGCGL